MGYSEVEDVRKILVGNRNDAATNVNPNVLDSDQILVAIGNADSQIDAALRRRYTVPFDPIPETIKFISIDIAAYLADLTFRGAREYENERYPFALRYDRARRMLEDLGSGRRLLENLEDDGATVINPYEGTLMTTRNIFTRWPEGTIRDD